MIHCTNIFTISAKESRSPSRLVKKGSQQSILCVLRPLSWYTSQTASHAIREPIQPVTTKKCEKRRLIQTRRRAGRRAGRLAAVGVARCGGAVHMFDRLTGGAKTLGEGRKVQTLLGTIWTSLSKLSSAPHSRTTERR